MCDDELIVKDFSFFLEKEKEIPENEEIHLHETCDGESGFDEPNEHEVK